MVLNSRVDCMKQFIYLLKNRRRAGEREREREREFAHMHNTDTQIQVGSQRPQDIENGHTCHLL
jgi:hypothetical protein